MVEKKNKPRFNVSNVGMRRSRLKNRGYRWRRPRADSNKKKMKRAFAGASPRIGYRNPPEMRGLHPSGLPEVLVHTESELVGVSEHVIRIASAVGAKRAALIEKAAEAAKLRVLNPRRKKKLSVAKASKKKDLKLESSETSQKSKPVSKTDSKTVEQLKPEKPVSKIDNKEVVEQLKPKEPVSKIESPAAPQLKPEKKEVSKTNSSAAPQSKPEKPVLKTEGKDVPSQEVKTGDKK